MTKPDSLSWFIVTGSFTIEELPDSERTASARACLCIRHAYPRLWVRPVYHSR